MQRVPVANIEVPKKWRTVKKAVVAQMAESFGREGQLQAIGVRPNPDKPGSFLLVWGRHRLEAAKKRAWETIDARVMDLGPAEAETATVAENLIRHPLSAGEKVIAIKALAEAYAARHPETVDRLGRAAAAQYGPDDAETTPGFADATSATTGIPASTVKRFVAAGSKLTDEQLGVLAEDPAVKVEHIKAINKLEPARRGEAVNMIAAGASPREAIATATLPVNATREEIGDPDAHRQTEEDMSDEAWLETYCGEVLAQLKYQVPYKRDALLYRHTRDIRQKLRAASKKPLAQSHVQITGPFYMLYSRFVNVDHPSRWQKCGVCGGTGISGESGVKSQCGNCRGHAYAVKSAGGGR